MNTEHNTNSRGQSSGYVTSDNGHQKMHTVMPGRHKGSIWLDCSAGAFRDFNAAAHLRKYSPDTKVVLIVRDPWQVRKIEITMTVQWMSGELAKDHNDDPYNVVNHTLNFLKISINH
mmetsp:Transcript_13733/g.22715  ORF Transcript_13733/g.22715 Transcript_13733/m.22715 type:complete len:117 (-) Transcript_13733:961-1311(-)